ncbi:16S rRNA (uracil(1498)-N(3))-methyltransferase [Marinobacterium sp. AK62]|uniref:Ribosomal RNA small subunit methyltransferase E n=1 Tax=Marinobacterium alkalitolerans TaxID=1542925 RepID=A0ABS3ZB71_9GAMM|nr:16S rRNA (uracil(1498)-N(3))-methyltransferase [Marinobacterium alkalitolerans]MBP0048952.1 16S rRNA (uracil(1498)-N(3))-methyltransferase [Marinobacterium alkalitolerans]
MNLILLYTSDFIDARHVRISDRRFHHMRQVHDAQPGDSFKVGVLNGLIGRGDVVARNDDYIDLSIRLDRAPPKPLPLRLIMALPRPKMLKRTLETVATLGVKELWLINSYRVDKSYWSTPILAPARIREHFLLGLEQAGDTRMPEVHIRKRFKPFVEDELADIAKGTRALVAHPYDAEPCPHACSDATTLAIGPEGGFIAYEVEKLQAAGLTPIHLGPRILRVETAVPVLLSRLFPL